MRGGLGSHELEGVWRTARKRAGVLLRQAERDYPASAGYSHEQRSDGWPDPRCDVAVYRRVADRRHRDGYRLDLVAVVRREVTS